jgi:hypothetical protein
MFTLIVIMTNIFVKNDSEESSNCQVAIAEVYSFLKIPKNKGKMSSLANLSAQTDEDDRGHHTLPVQQGGNEKGVVYGLDRLTICASAAASRAQQGEALRCRRGLSVFLLTHLTQ